MTRISPATVTFCVMAIVLGLVGAYVVRKAMHKEPVVEAPKPAPKVDPGIPVVFYRANTNKKPAWALTMSSSATFPREPKPPKGTRSICSTELSAASPETH